MFQKCKPKQLLHIFLSVSIFCNSIYAHARKSDLPAHEPQFPGQKYEGIGYFSVQSPEDLEFEKQLNELVDKNEVPDIEKISKTDDLKEVLEKFHAAVLKARPRLQAEQERLGPEKFRQALANDKIAFDQDGIHIEYTSVEGYPVARVKHERSGVAIVFIDETVIDYDSKALFLYLARQHFMSGNKRPDKAYVDERGKVKHIVGRDNIYVWVSNDNIKKVEFKPRPKKFTKEWWKEYWTAIWQKPTHYHVGVGTTSGLAQYSQNLVVAGIFTWAASQLLGGEVTITDPPTVVAALSLGFGATIGIFTRTFHNWRTIGPKHVRQRKDEVVNVSMYLGIKSVSEDGLIKTFNILDKSNAIAAWFNIFQFIATWKVNNTLKQPWNKFGDIRAQARDDQSNLILRAPKRIIRDERGYFRVTEYFPWQWETPMKLTDWNRQFKYYLPRNALTMTDRIWFTWFMHQYIEGNVDWYVPWISTAMLVAMIPISWHIVHRWVKKHYPNSPYVRQIEDEGRAFLSWRGAYDAFMTNVDNVVDKIKGLPESAMNLAKLVPRFFTDGLKSPEIDQLDLRSEEKKRQTMDGNQKPSVKSQDCEDKLKTKDEDKVA